MRARLSLDFVGVVGMMFGLLGVAACGPGTEELEDSAQLESSLEANGIFGYGSVTTGGAGGAILYVRNTNASGTGSFRQAVLDAKKSTGPDIIKSLVSGTVVLGGDVDIDFRDLTIDFSDAPAPGLQLRDGGLLVKTGARNIILRYVKVRSGDFPASEASETDAVTLNGLKGLVERVVVDHCSLLWGPDIGGVAILGNVQDVTVQNTIMGEGLYLSSHEEGYFGDGPLGRQEGHSMGSSIFKLTAATGARRITMYRNLYTTADRRMPVVHSAEQVDLVNNVIYNWNRTPPGGNPKSMNYVGNMLKPGPMTKANLSLWKAIKHSSESGIFSQTLFESNNLGIGTTLKRESGNGQVYRSTPAAPYSVPVATASDALMAQVLSEVGATKPIRDYQDDRVVKNVINKDHVLPNGTRPAVPRYPNGAGRSATDLNWKM